MKPKECSGVQGPELVLIYSKRNTLTKTKEVYN